MSTSSGGFSDRTLHAFSIALTAEALRRRSGKSQAVLAKLCCSSQPMISRIERGTVIPDIVLWQRMSIVLGTTVPELDAIVEEVKKRTESMARSVLDGRVKKEAWMVLGKQAGIDAVRGLVMVSVAVIMSNTKEGK